MTDENWLLTENFRLHNDYINETHMISMNNRLVTTSPNLEIIHNLILEQKLNRMSKEYKALEILGNDV